MRGSVQTNTARVYHVMRANENFEDTARMIVKLIAEAQKRAPDMPRSFYLDIEGHRNEVGGYDSDAYEIQTGFLDVIAPYVVEVHIPLGHFRMKKTQSNDVPSDIDVRRE